MKRYRVCGVELYQDDLTWEEYERCKEVLKDKISIFSGDPVKFGEALDELYSKQIIQRLIPLFLKLYEPHLWLKIKNRYHLWKSGMSMARPMEKMKGEQLAQIMVDFFLCNLSWTTSLLVLPPSSNSRNQPTPHKLRTLMRSLLSTSQKTTPQKLFN